MVLVYQRDEVRVIAAADFTNICAPGAKGRGNGTLHITSLGLRGIPCFNGKWSF